METDLKGGMGEARGRLRARRALAARKLRVMRERCSAVSGGDWRLTPAIAGGGAFSLFILEPSARAEDPQLWRKAGADYKFEPAES